MLVVPSTVYHRAVPPLIGTNVLTVLMSITKDANGPQFLQKAELQTPWYLALRCVTLRERELTSGIIRRYKSPWTSNIVLCRKKDGKLRMCVDYRQLNERTTKDSYALPRIDEILDALLGNKYFSVLDMKSGYHQIEIDEEHKQRTAFTVGPLGFYEYNRMPFGLANAPATYLRLMEDCFRGLHLDICFIYLDDVIVFSKTYEEHVDRLDKVFKRIREEGLKLSPSNAIYSRRR